MVLWFVLAPTHAHAAPEEAPAMAETPTAAPASTVQKSGDVTIFDVKIHYVEAGSGPTVVLLHGLGGSSTDLFSLAALAKKFRVIVPDQIGFGKSDKPLINYRVGTYVDFLDRFLTELKIERASLVGSSFGGWVAASYALAHPERVERLVLVDSAGFALPAGFDSSQLKGLNASTRQGVRELIKLSFYNQALFDNEAFVDMVFAQRMGEGDGYTIRTLLELIASREESLDNRLGAIKAPTLVIWGRQDKILPVADGGRFAREIPGAQLLVFEGCGHVAQIEKALAFNTAVTDFLGPTAKQQVAQK